MPDVTFVVAVDHKHIEQLEVVLPAWRIFAPEIWQHPLRLIYDWETVKPEFINGFLDKLQHEMAVAFPWPRTGIRYMGQREKMLTAFVVLAPSLCQTAWWCKIDTDAMPKHRDQRWLSDEWFDPIQDAKSGFASLPCFVAPHWGYTHIRKGGSPMAFDDWADGVPELANAPRTGIVHAPEAKRVAHSRMCSWLSFYRTNWTLWAAGLLAGDRLPIPSQDGFHSLLAIRTQAPWRHYPAKQLGWCNHPRIDTLRQAVTAALAKDRAASS